VLITKNKDRQSNGCGYSCFGWTIDAHPEDINKVDFPRPRTKTPVMRTIGDYRQLNDAGTNSGAQYEFEDTRTGCTSTCSTCTATRPAYSPTTSRSATSTAPARTRAA
jgi:hypothetical protein